MTVPALLTIAEAAEILRVTPVTIKRKITRGDLAAVKIGTGPGAHVRVRADSLQQLLRGDRDTDQGDRRMTARKKSPAEQAVDKALAQVADRRERLAATRHQERTLQTELASAAGAIRDTQYQAAKAGDRADVTEQRTALAQLEQDLADLEPVIAAQTDAVTEAGKAVWQVRLERYPQLADVLEAEADELVKSREEMQQRHAEELANQRAAERRVTAGWDDLNEVVGRPARMALEPPTRHAQAGAAMRPGKRRR